MPSNVTKWQKAMYQLRGGRYCLRDAGHVLRDRSRKSGTSGHQRRPLRRTVECVVFNRQCIVINRVMASRVLSGVPLLSVQKPDPGGGCESWPGRWCAA